MIKDNIFPDPAFQVKTTLMSFGISWALVLGPYLVPAYRLASGAVDNSQVSFERMWVCTLSYIFGIVFMLVSDA